MSEPLPLPKYHQVYLVLRQQLDEGRFEHQLPSELRLTQQFGVARVTVRKALERLASEGRILRAPGRGTTRVQPPDAARAAAAPAIDPSIPTSAACSRTSSAWVCAPR